jgi:putative phage-type endonuclease
MASIDTENKEKKERNLFFHLNKDLRPFTQDRKKYLQEQVERLKKIPQPEQRSPEWYLMRDGMISASDSGTVLGQSHYGNRDSVILKKCGEESRPPSGAAIDWGVKYENVAKQIYELRNEVEVFEFGCIKHPTIDFLGASPDGITNDGIMLEIKCPSSRIIDGIIPTGYYCQVQMQLEVCELDRCDFLECKLKEYISEEDYINDNFNGNNFYNSIGFEKGVVAEYFILADKKYKFDYSPIGILGQELEDWKNKAISKYEYINDKSIIFASFSYWYLEEVSCIPIYRNQEWFNNSYPELKKCWGDIIYYRGLENGLYILKNDIQNKKNQKKEEKTVAKNIKEEAKALAKAEKKPAAKRAKKDKDSNNMTMLDFVETNNNMQIAEPKDYEEDENFNKKGLCLFSEDEPYYENEESNYITDNITDNKTVNMCLFSEDESTQKSNNDNFKKQTINLCLFND